MEESFKRLLFLRNKYGLSDTEFAEKIGVPKSSMSMYLSGKRKMRQDRIAIVAKIFNVSEAWLMGYDASMVPESEEEPFSAQFVEKNRPESALEDMRVAYARNRSKLTKEERMKLAAEILQDEEDI